MKRIFVLDDDPGMVLMATTLLEQMGYAVSSESDSLKGIARVTENVPDLLLLDIRMPEKDGFDVCRELKANAKTKNLPIIMVSTLSGESDVVTGLELGAVDYVCKPFRERELQARVKAALRQKENDLDEEHIQAGPLKINPENFSAFLDGAPLPLRPKEFQLLAFFIKMEGRVLTRSKISNSVWGHEYDPKMRTIDRHVDVLRKKLGKYGVWIKGLRGIGYRFDLEDAE